MGTRQLIQTYIDSERDPMFYVWEDDSGEKCNFNPSEHEDIEYKVALAAGAGTGAGIAAIITGAGGPYAWAYTITSAVMSVAAYWHASAGDDFIGIVTVPAGSDPAMNPKTIMHSDHPRNRGSLYMQFRPQN